MAIKSRAVETLNTKSIGAIKPNGKRQLFYDGDYLYLSVSAKGAKSFYFRGYAFNGKKINEFSIGTYRKSAKDNSGDLTLAEARDKAREIIRTYRAGNDYHQQQKTDRLQAEYEQSNTLNDWFTRWIETKSDKAESTQKDYKGRYLKWVSPVMGKRPLTQVTIDEIENLYTKIQSQCSPEMAKRCHIILNGIYTLAIKKRITTNNPTQLAKDEIKTTQTGHFPAIVNDNDIGELLLSMDNYKGYISTVYAYKLIPYLMLQPANLVALKWADIDFKERLTHIDGERMKTGYGHCIPYPHQVATALHELHEYTGQGEYLFPNRQGKNHISRDTLSKGLRGMGFAGKHTPHGFRSMATTWLYNQKYYSYAIEKQLAHTEPNKVVRAYSRDDVMRYIDDRRTMLQDWANHLDNLKQKAK
ncbi:MAG: tyrosine-type recombinase/integrase [Gammaproteobacteria bacterium]|nr:tyrosine-type recombinase/integrase [Gammaproteobacteria bacterium]